MTSHGQRIHYPLLPPVRAYALLHYCKFAERRITESEFELSRLIYPVEEFDPYKLDDPAHDPKAFYPFCGKDSEVTRIRIPTKYMHIAAEIVASREIPEYKTPHDLFRDGIHHRIYYLTKVFNRPQYADTITSYQERERSRERREAIEVRKETIQALRDEFNLANQERSRNACQQAIEATERLLDSREADDDLYKDELVRLLGYMKLQAGML